MKHNTILLTDDELATMRVCMYEYAKLQEQRKCTVSAAHIRKVKAWIDRQLDQAE